MSDLIPLHLAALRARGLSENTVADRERLLRALDRDLPHGLDVAAAEELQDWLGRAGWTTKTRETYWCHIVGFYRWAARGRSQRLDWDPSEDLDRPKPRRRLPRVASDDQLHRCLDELDRPVLRAVILAAGAGMRAGEIAGAERDNFDGRQVVILGKGDKVRVVPLMPEVWDEVRDCPPGRLVTDNGQPVDAHWVTRKCAAAFDRLGEPKLTIHWFRGAFATRLRRAGVDSMAIARLLGHSSVATTQLYIQLDERDLATAMGRLPSLAQASRATESEPGSSRLRSAAEAA